jgi:hypothetical protein
MSREYWLSKITPIRNQIKSYKNNKLALTNKELDNLYDEKAYWLNRCEHWETETKTTYYDSWEYCGHLEWWYKETFCKDCKKSLKKVPIKR